jgi:hypothetical protein
VRLLASLTLVVLSALLSLTLAVSPAATQPSPTLEFSPATLDLAEAAVGVVDIRLLAATDLASYEVDLAFDPAIVSVDRVERIVGSDAQPSPDRSWASLPSNDPAMSYVVRSPGHISFGGYSFGVNNPPGLNGDVTLVRLHLRGVGAGTSSLVAERILVTTSSAQPSNPTATPGNVTVQGPAFRLFLPHLTRGEPSPAQP